ncbi:glutamate-1-semialdehyde 2,1-aminomutase [Geosmithia morbida]|uniref:Glutamate-1-semialdehyde 2,1-aminomutase n=1 Tax=Geosmithia morbida TaxID=1094350 RepID=A0A9P4YSH7_9HYPO|nr:glutamate-1-semialdehyde 2,1-aminomutase [Geosmithia morbida]KAF4121707.1 glutamate-1-semialdehyde 2,1-aminomutase [Geosmithia morbida]
MAPVAVTSQDAEVPPASKLPAVSAAPADEEVCKRLASAVARFTERNPVSKRQYEIAVNNLPGGNTRTLLHTSPFPLVMKRGRGPFVWDEDDHKYTDMVGELTAGIYGHSHPVIREAIVSTFDNVGLNLGSTIVQEQKHAELMCSRFTLERVRFTNSGTEANLHALNAAKHFTGKTKVVVFDGAYHGAVFSFGDGTVAPNNVDKGDWIVGKYNDVDGARHTIENTPDVAAVMVEGMQGAGGCILGTEEFLLQVQVSAKKAGAVFLLDEVMTSRLSPGGLQSILGLKPDLTSFGKYLGGGFSFGAFGGREDIMAAYDPRTPGSLSHSGTFNNNTMTMYAGYAGLSKVLTPEASAAFNSKGEKYLAKLQGVTKGTKASFTGRGSVWAIHFSDTGIQDIKSIADIEERWDLKDIFWFEMTELGFWITRRGSIALILGTPDEELDRFVECVTKFLEKHKGMMAV